jgi:hypothetical protein
MSSESWDGKGGGGGEGAGGGGGEEVVSLTASVGLSGDRICARCTNRAHRIHRQVSVAEKTKTHLATNLCSLKKS